MNYYELLIRRHFMQNAPDVESGILVCYVDSADTSISAPSGAQWSYDGGVTWNNIGGGYPVTLNAGTYTIIFNTIDGYETPAEQTVTVVSGQTNYVYSGAWTATPVETTGLLEVITSPTLTPPTGAQWSIDGVTWNSFGLRISVPVGTYIVQFKDVSGYTTPASQTATVTAGQVTSITVGEYVASGGESGGGTTPEALQEFWLDSGVANVNGHYTLISNSASEILWQNDSTPATVTAEYSTVDNEWTWTVSSGATPCYGAISTSTDITAVQWQFAVGGASPLPTISTTDPGSSGGGSASGQSLRLTSSSVAAGCVQVYNLTSGDPSRTPTAGSNSLLFTGVTDSTWTIVVEYESEFSCIGFFVKQNGNNRYNTGVRDYAWQNLADTVAQIQGWSDASEGLPVNITLTVEES